MLAQSSKNSWREKKATTAGVGLGLFYTTYVYVCAPKSRFCGWPSSKWIGGGRCRFLFPAANNYTIYRADVISLSHHREREAADKVSSVYSQQRHCRLLGSHLDIQYNHSSKSTQHNSRERGHRVNNFHGTSQMRSSSVWLLLTLAFSSRNQTDWITTGPSACMFCRRRRRPLYLSIFCQWRVPEKSIRLPLSCFNNIPAVQQQKLPGSSWIPVLSNWL